MRLTACLACLIALSFAAGGPTWRRLPAAPAPARSATSAVAVWTGKELVVFGRSQPHPPWSVDVAAAYDPARRTWRPLHPFPGPNGNYEGSYHAVWTGRLVLVVGPFDDQAYDPATNRWRKLPQPHLAHPFGVVAWTGRELVAWGGGCCGDASNDGVAFEPATGTWRRLPASPLAPSQSPAGAFDGHELIVVVSGIDPDTGHPYPARLARAAAYDPAGRTWRRLPAPPVRRLGAAGVWDGSELLLVGGSSGNGSPATARRAPAYDPAANRWRLLPAMPALSNGFGVTRAGGRVLAWGGDRTAGCAEWVPGAGRWFPLPAGTLHARVDPALAWTGTQLLVWGGLGAADGAALTL